MLKKRDLLEKMQITGRKDKIRERCWKEKRGKEKTKERDIKEKR